MNARRITPVAQPGSLLRADRPPKAGKRPKRELMPDHLALVRRCPCLSCDADPAGVAAHLRIGLHGGVGLKPADHWAVPLCNECHTEQHNTGELVFWLKLRLDPVAIANDLARASPSLGVMRSIVFKAREMRK